MEQLQSHIWLTAFYGLKGMSYEIDFENVDENWQNLALIRVAAGFWVFEGTSDF